MQVKLAIWKINYLVGVKSGSQGSTPGLVQPQHLFLILDYLC